MIKRYNIFADYHQFYLWDHGASPDAPTEYTEEDTVRRIKTGSFVVVVQPERNMDVPVEFEITDEPPDLDLDAWDHVAEASLDLPSGRLEIHECTGGSIDVLADSTGTYRVQTYHGGLNTLSEDRLDGDNRYRIVLWPAPFTSHSDEPHNSSVASIEVPAVYDARNMASQRVRTSPITQL